MNTFAWDITYAQISMWTGIRNSSSKRVNHANVKHVFLKRMSISELSLQSGYWGNGRWPLPLRVVLENNMKKTFVKHWQVEMQIFQIPNIMTSWIRGKDFEITQNTLKSYLLTCYIKCNPWYRHCCWFPRNKMPHIISNMDMLPLYLNIVNTQ